MEMIIVWTDEAITELREIFNYYRTSTGLQNAQKILSSIVDCTLILEKHPRAGQREELLRHLPEEIRYLVEANYKIVYWIENNFVIKQLYLIAAKIRKN